jgi:SAM-dependent methyltransferase
VLHRLGWEVLATDHIAAAVAIARDRGLSAAQADACHLPVRTGACDLLVAFDVLEHIESDASAAAEIFRVLRPGGTALIAVPCDMRLWSDHDVISGHHRRYARPGLAALIEGAGLRIERLWSWNVLLRPALTLRRGTGWPAPDSPLRDVTDVHPLLNAALGAVVRLERRLPLGALPGTSLMVRARRP